MVNRKDFLKIIYVKSGGYFLRVAGSRSGISVNSNLNFCAVMYVATEKNQTKV